MNIIAGKDLEIPAFLRRENKVANTDTGAVPEKKVNGAEPTPKTETSEAVAPVKKEPPLRSGTPAQQKAADEERAKKRAAEGLPPTEAKQAPVKKEAKPAAKPSAKVIPMRKAEQAPAKGKAAPAPAKGKATPAKAAPAPPPEPAAVPAGATRRRSGWTACPPSSAGWCCGSTTTTRSGTASSS